MKPKRLIKIRAGLYRYDGKKTSFKIEKIGRKWRVQDNRNKADFWIETTLKKSLEAIQHF